MPTPFQTTILRHLKREGLQVRRILRIYPPMDLGDYQEILFLAMDGQAGTLWVDQRGELVHGPVPGFGP